MLACQNGSGPCGWHVYAVHPEIQVGPLSLLVAVPFALLHGMAGAAAARLAMAAVGLAVVLVIERGLPATDSAAQVRQRWRVLLAGMPFLMAWTDLAVGFAHLDDVLALLCTTLAVHSVNRGRGRWVGWFLAAATLSKPWAVAFLPLVLALPRDQRWQAARNAVLPPVVVALAIVAFDPNSLRAAAFRIPNVAASALRVLGVTERTPTWDRPAQFLLGALLAVIAVRSGRWQGTIMLAAAARIMLDPEVYSYYSAGILLGTMLWDVQVRPGRRVPVWTWVTFAALVISRYLPVESHDLGLARLAICLTLIVCALLLPGSLAAVIPPAKPQPDQPDLAET